MRERLLDPAADPSRTALGEFIRHCEGVTGHSFPEPIDLHRWSVEDWRGFWSCFVDWSGVQFDGSTEPVCVGDELETARFFPEMRLSWVEHILGGGGVGLDDVAVISVDEAGARHELTRRELATRVSATARGLRDRGLGRGDQVVALVRNDLEAIVAALAATGLGAVWSSVAPDLGPRAIVDRFVPLHPKWLFSHSRTVIQGREIDLTPLVREVAGSLESLEHIFVLGQGDDRLEGFAADTLALRDLEIPGDEPFAWPRLPFDHPLFVMFSSGTTGTPKCIIHGVGGTLLEHLKEHRLHGDLGPGDRLHFHTSCGWMMWNWLVGGLAAGATIVVRDGSPTAPELDSLWRTVASEQVTVLGANPTWLQFCRDAGMDPVREHDLSALRAFQSTGSILFPEQFDWVQEHVGRIPVHSISGGTDILGCFVLGHPHRPLIRGESQMLSLAMDVRAFDPEGREVAPGEVGELVCVNPFPSRPVGLANDPGGERFHAAYFADHAGVWTHGDFIEIHGDGGARILGRSDGVLNVRGIRIGPAEIYAVLRQFETITKALAVEQSREDLPGGARIVLLVVLREGEELDRPLTLKIKKALKTEASPNHVPGLIVAVTDLPVTFSGKLSEKAARDAVNGREVGNAAALANPECLDEILRAAGS